MVINRYLKGRSSDAYEAHVRVMSNVIGVEVTRTQGKIMAKILREGWDYIGKAEREEIRKYMGGSIQGVTNFLNGLVLSRMLKMERRGLYKVEDGIKLEKLEKGDVVKYHLMFTEEKGYEGKVS